jgi:hypothetical protein
MIISYNRVTRIRAIDIEILIRNLIRIYLRLGAASCRQKCRSVEMTKSKLYQVMSSNVKLFTCSRSLQYRIRSRDEASPNALQSCSSNLPSISLALVRRCFDAGKSAITRYAIRRGSVIARIVDCLSQAWASYSYDALFGFLCLAC